MPLPWFALPVIFGAASQHGVSWIEFGDNDTVSGAAAAFCSEVNATGSALSPTSNLPDFEQMNGPVTGCLEHVMQALESRRRSWLAQQEFLRAHSWTWTSATSQGEMEEFSLKNAKIQIVHIWIGPASMPQDYSSIAKEWRAKHWNSSVVSADIRKLEFPSSERVPLKTMIGANIDVRSISDVLRLEYLYDNGGVYADVDVWPVRSFDKLVLLAKQENAVIFGMESPDVVSNSVIISPSPKHSFLKWLLQNLPAWARLHGGRRACDRTGPGFLTAAIRWVFTSPEGVMMRRGVLLVDRRTFNPIHFSSLDGTGETSKDVLTRWLKTRDFVDSDMVFGVQGWNSQITFVPTKIEFGDVTITQDGELQVSLMIFPWQGRDAEAARGWRVCVQEIGPSTRQRCIVLPLNRQIETLEIPFAPQIS